MIASGVTNIVLLVVGAAWLAVLLPPLLRSRVENRPGSSIVDFRRQLASLQRTVPTRGVTPMRHMARPLAPSTGSRSHGAMREHVSRSPMQSASLDRRSVATVRSASHSSPVRSGSHHPHGQVHVQRRPSTVARREVQQRRQNVLMALVGLTLGSAVLAFATANSVLTYVFVLSAVSLVGYCYKLVQLKHATSVSPYGSLHR
jgi:hypothetical protein